MPKVRICSAIFAAEAFHKHFHAETRACQAVFSAGSLVSSRELAKMVDQIPWMTT
jgi:hypothetical protein